MDLMTWLWIVLVVLALSAVLLVTVRRTRRRGAVLATGSKRASGR